MTLYLGLNRASLACSRSPELRDTGSVKSCEKLFAKSIAKTSFQAVRQAHGRKRWAASSGGQCFRNAIYYYTILGDVYYFFAAAELSLPRAASEQRMAAADIHTQRGAMI